MDSRGALNLSEEERIDVIEGRGKTTLGMVLAPLLKDSTEINTANAELLSKALKHRNYIVHRFFIENSERLMNAEQCKNVLGKLSGWAMRS